MASNYVVEIDRGALAEIEEAYLWLTQEAPEYAPTWFHSLLDATDTLEHFPQRCSLAPENDLVDFEVRHLLHGKGRAVYRIIFTIVESTIRVLHVRHASRLPLKPDEF